MKNILCIIPNASDATSFYRGIGPLTQIRNQTRAFNFIFSNKITWAELAMIDGVFMQRPYKEDHLSIVKMAKDMGKKVWVDYDDDLFSVPVSNPTHVMYGKDSVKQTVAQIMAHADAISCSTYALEKLYKPFEKNNALIKRIPNGLNDHILKTEILVKPLPNKLFLWRGSKTHEKDVMKHGGHMVGFLEGKKDWTMAFTAHASDLWFLAEKMPKQQCIFVEPMDIIDYHKFLTTVNAAAMMVPLADCPFNQSKSNIAWLEAAWAGMAAIVPHPVSINEAWQEWAVPAFHYEGPKLTSFGDALIEASDLDKARQVGMEARKYVLDKLLVSKLNKDRIEILDYITR